MALSPQARPQSFWCARTISPDKSYRNGHHSGSGEYRPSVNVKDLVGGNSSYTIWYNRQTLQCIQIGVADGRVANIAGIQTAPKYR